MFLSVWPNKRFSRRHTDGICRSETVCDWSYRLFGLFCLEKSSSDDKQPSAETQTSSDSLFLPAQGHIYLSYLPYVTWGGGGEI